MMVLWTRAAEAGLEEISDYIRADNPEPAVSFVNEIIDAGEAIAKMPRAFALVPPLEHKGIRRRPFGNYLIFYLVERDTVAVTPSGPVPNRDRSRRLSDDEKSRHGGLGETTTPG